MRDVVDVCRERQQRVEGEMSSALDEVVEASDSTSSSLELSRLTRQSRGDKSVSLSLLGKTEESKRQRRTEGISVELEIFELTSSSPSLFLPFPRRLH